MLEICLTSRITTAIETTRRQIHDRIAQGLTDEQGGEAARLALDTGLRSSPCSRSGVAGPGQARFALDGEPIAWRLPRGQFRTDLGIDGWDGWDVWAEISTIRERPRMLIFRVNGVPRFEAGIDCPRSIEMRPIENRLPRCFTGTTDCGGAR